VEHGLGMRLPNAQPTSNEERGGAAQIGMLCGCRGKVVPVERKHGETLQFYTRSLGWVVDGMFCTLAFV